ncbi:MAG: hypothetical protein NXI31_08155 [bacterium]|nr:hypothetical protein [bacterium]
MSDKDNDAPEIAAEGATEDTNLDTAAPASEESGTAEPISDLMASGEAPAATAAESEQGAAAAEAASSSPRPDLDADAMAAAQAAIAEGERALAAARAQLGRDDEGKKRGSKRRELALRLLLAANVLAMVVVMAIPTSPEPVDDPAPHQPEAVAHGPGKPAEPGPAVPAGPRLADKYNQALVASEGGNHARAIELLEEYLAESPRMTPSRRVNVYRQIAHYSGAVGNITKAQDYERRAQSLTQSHYLPQDLVATAQAAVANNDQVALRQVWARFLLQQRQIPSSLYQHVAEAYLQLGDSYRQQANDSAEKARLEELQRIDDMLQQQNQSKGTKR